VKIVDLGKSTSQQKIRPFLEAGFFLSAEVFNFHFTQFKTSSNIFGYETIYYEC